MKPKQESRGAQIDAQRLSEATGNRFKTIQILSQRVYDLRRGAESTITDYLDPYNSGPVTALLELQKELNV